MSMNIAFEATREIMVMKTRTTELQSQFFNVWQIPTEITYKIVDSDDPIQEYKDWVMSHAGCTYTMLVYAEDDPFGDGEPIGSKTVDPRVDHLTEFEQWLKTMEQTGYDVEPIVL
jgi:hypothetical protein